MMRERVVCEMETAARDWDGAVCGGTGALSGEIRGEEEKSERRREPTE